MDEQQRLLERLPDYLNGHVEGDDARHIAALLESDAAWKTQAALLGDVRAAIAAQMEEVDNDTGLAELKRRIAKPDTAVPRSSWWQRLGASFLGPALTPALMATLAGVCVMQGWMLYSTPNTEIAWRNAPLGVATPAANLEVRFSADASLAQVEAALIRAESRIVAGPQGGQRYLLQARDPAAAVVQLRASAVVVESTVLVAGPSP